MTARHFIYGTLMTSPEVTDLVDDRIWAKKTMTSSVEQTPYLVYKLGNSTPEDFSEEREIDRQFFQVYVHDFNDGQTADYDKVDLGCKAVRNAFHNANSAENKVWTTRYIETSQDLNDETLNTVFRYLRFQLITEE